MTAPAKLLAPWFARHTVAELAATFAGTSVLWAHLHDLASPCCYDKLGQTPSVASSRPDRTALTNSR
jgi:hypothetical protein